MKKRILLPISPAELMDKIAILELKARKISDSEKLKNVKHELEVLMEVFKKNIKRSKESDKLFDELRQLSARGWKIEDIKRDCERKGDFGPKFINAARGAFKNNDARAAIWKEINTHLKSDIVQEKSYKKY
ncbi:MAG: hypothetical protein G01um101444_117 [Parcubacteria group bacterium Gr01-1014_44]|nr:MAG: hypothetical protein G01um101444_117 [Parcubacteria group bacterium Gr01-1014_44]